MSWWFFFRLENNGLAILLHHPFREIAQRFIHFVKKCNCIIRNFDENRKKLTSERRSSKYKGNYILFTVILEQNTFFHLLPHVQCISLVIELKKHVCVKISMCIGSRNWINPPSNFTCLKVLWIWNMFFHVWFNNPFGGFSITMYKSFG